MNQRATLEPDTRQENIQLRKASAAALNLMEDAVEARRRAEQVVEALRDTQAALLRAQQAAHAGLWEIDLSSRAMTWSPAYYELYGLPATAEACLETWKQRLHPDDRAETEEHLLRTLEQPGPHCFQFRILRPDGTVRWIQRQGDMVRDDSGRPLRLSGISIDITERKQAEEALFASEERYRMTFENAAVGMAHVGLDGRWLRVNQTLCRITGYSTEELLSTTVLEITDPEDLALTQASMRRLLSGEVSNYTIEKRYRKKDGTIVWVTVCVSLKHAAGDAAARYFIGIVSDITERVRAEAKLAQQQRLLSSVTDNASLGLLITNERQQCLFMNPAAERLTGFTLEDLRGRPLHDVIHHTRPDGTAYPVSDCPMDRAFPMDRQIRGEEMFVHKDGHFYPVAFTASPIRDASGRPSGTVIEVQDISDRKRAEEALRRSEHRLRLLAETAELLLRSESPLDLVNDLCARVMHFLDCQTFFNYVLHPDLGTLRLNAWAGLPDDERRAAWLEPGSALRGCLALEGRAIVMEDVGDRTDAGGELVRSLGIRAYACHPLSAQGTVIGTLSFGTRTRSSFLSDDLSLMKAVADQVAIAMQRKRNEDALRQREEELRNTSALLNTLLANAPVGFAFFDEELRYRVVNNALAEMNGLPVEAHLGKTIREIVPDVADTAERVCEEILRTGQPVLDREFFGTTAKEPGLLRSWDESWYPIYSADNRFLGLGVLVQETTDRKRHQELLREREQRLRTAMEAGQMGAWDFDLASGAVTWDAKQYEIYGCSPGEAPSDIERFYDLVHPGDVARLKRSAAQALETGRFSDEFRIVRRDGVVRWIAGDGVTIPDHRGLPRRMVGINYDITERKESQEHLERFAGELERLVGERTRELVQSQERLRSLATELTLTEQRERKKLATVLHDHLAQLLVLCRLKLNQSKRVEGVARPCLDLIKATDEVLGEALTYTRTLVADLTPPVLHDLGLREALQWLATHMQRYEMTVSIEDDAADELKLPEDLAVLLFESVRELLMNSYKHADTHAAVVSMSHREGRLVIQVRDHGRGFSATAGAAEDAAFTKFGLFSIRERMRTLGGRLDLESEPGKGTTATLTLPLPSRDGSRAVSPEPASFTQPPLSTQHPAHSSTTIRVLLVDDHAMVRQGLRSVLEGYPDVEVVGEAADGEDAITAAATWRPTLMVMDINMPRLNGIEATARIKSRFPEIAVIGLSVQAGDETRRAMLEAGASLLLTKEAAVDQLYESILSVTERSRPQTTR